MLVEVSCNGRFGDSLTASLTNNTVVCAVVLGYHVSLKRPLLPGREGAFGYRALKKVVIPEMPLLVVLEIDTLVENLRAVLVRAGISGFPMF